MAEHKSHMSLYIPQRLKRRLKLVADDRQISMNDLVNQAIKNDLDRIDDSYSAPDLVLDRLSELLNAQIANATLLNKQNQVLTEVLEVIEALKDKQNGNG